MKKDETKNSIFCFMDYREYLREWFQEAKNRRFSLRAFAKRAGFRSHNFLKMVMNGDRNLTGASLAKCLKGLHLARRESDYFRNLVAYNQAEDPEERQKFYEQLLQAQELSQVRQISEDQYHYYGAWYHTAIREMIHQSDFKEDPSWIAGRLNPPIKEEQAKQSLELLERLGFVSRNKEGRLAQTNKLLTTGPEVRSELVKQYHRFLLDLAKTAMERIPREQRDISALTLGVSQKTLPLLKRRIQLFREEILRLISTSTETDLIIQLNLQLFPLTSLTKEATDRA